MGITVRANAADTTDYAAIRKDGYEALIDASACSLIAALVQQAGVTAYAYEGEEERFYGSYVPACPLVTLPADVQTNLLAILAGNAEAQRIVRKAIDHRVQITFGRDCGDNQYRVRLVSERADNVDLALSGGNWKGFRNAIGLDGENMESDIDCGELAIADVEQALRDSSSALMFSGAWQQQVAQRLSDLAAYAKAQGATSLVWA